MSAANTLLAAGVRLLGVQFGETITIDGRAYRAVINRVQRARLMTEFGYDPGYDLTAQISVADMPTPPRAESAQATYNGQRLRLVGSETDAAAHTLNFVFKTR